MKSIEIIYDEGDRCYGGQSYTVVMGERFQDGLGWDEALGLVASLLVPGGEQPRLRGRTYDEWDTWNSRYHRPCDPVAGLLEDKRTVEGAYVPPVRKAFRLMPMEGFVGVVQPKT